MEAKVNVTTTARETFTHEDSADLAWLVYRRFGRDAAAATAAWNRLLQNNCDEAQFMRLALDNETGR